MRRLYRPRYSTRRGHRIWPPLGTGRGTANWCDERGEWVEPSETCIDCPQYRDWDGTGRQCKYDYEWERMVDENFARYHTLESGGDFDMSNVAHDSEEELEEESKAQKYYPYADAEAEEAYRRLEELEAQQRSAREAEDHEDNEDKDE